MSTLLANIGTGGTAMTILSVSTAMLWAVLIIGVVMWAGQPWRRQNHAQQLLADRYARGELDTDEYQQRTQVLTRTTRR